MSSAQPSSRSDEPLRTMSIARFIPRFTKPRLLISNIPTYRHSFSLPIKQADDASTSEASTSSASSQQPDGTQTRSEELSAKASYVEWNKLLPVPSNLLASFPDLFAPPNNVGTALDKASQDGQHKSVAQARPPPRLIFFGEQHHQPQVMRAQLQTLHALHHQCQLASQPISQSSKLSNSSPTLPIYRLHLILEHFSVLDQHMLNSFTHANLSPDELAQTYQAQSEEAFHIGHYMPLLMLARELNVPIWGGFPPRRWAKQVFRDGVDSVKPQEERRAAPIQAPAASPPVSSSDQTQSSLPHYAASSARVQPPLFASWKAVTEISAAHRSYLSGLMRPDLPPRFPQLPDATSLQSHTIPESLHDEARSSSIYPTWLLKSHNIQTKGFGPAQALKDSYLAHVTAWVLRGAPQDKQSHQIGSSSPRAGNNFEQQTAIPLAAHTGDTDPPVINIALVVCGLGHCEYGFGAPERTVQLLSHQDDVSDDDAIPLPYIIASKPHDSGIWLGYEHSIQPTVPINSITDTHRSTQPHQPSQTDESRAPGSAPTSPESVQRWLNDPWGRKMADAVLLYDWIDDEPTDEADANADRHQPTSK